MRLQSLFCRRGEVPHYSGFRYLFRESVENRRQRVLAISVLASGAIPDNRQHTGSPMQTTFSETVMELCGFRHPAVRHMAWMCQAPQLLESALCFNPREFLPHDALSQLQRWDADPVSGPSVLTNTPNPRLGLYFESLYECLLRDLLGWEILARNLQIQSNGITLGELDFVLRNPRTGACEHHEVAVKFYLGYNSDKNNTEAGVTLWHGPNAIDRLDLKTRNLLEQQSQRTRLVETTDALATLGITGPLTKRIFMPGYLFYPREPLLSALEHVPADHLRGVWFTLEDALRMNSEHWVPLRKPHWLGPWQQADSPDQQAVIASLQEVQESGTPRLFAKLAFQAESSLWLETERFFVVPAHWPA